MADDILKALLAGGAVPSVALPPTSRYVDVGTRTWTPSVAPGGDPVPITYLARRFVPKPERFAPLYEVTCAEGDRRDLLAARHLGDPSLWWRIADANAVFDPAAMTEPVGRVLRITLPADVPGGGGDA
jgi:hypothetical protein